MIHSLHIYILAFALILLASLTLSSANAMDLAEAREITTTCKSSAECTSIAKTCNDTCDRMALNKTYYGQYRDAQQKVCGSSTPDQSSSKDAVLCSQPSQASCISGTCQIVSR